jgi:hypothetical protein
LQIRNQTLESIMNMHSPKEDNYMTDYNNNSSSSYQEYDMNDNYQDQQPTSTEDPGYIPPHQGNTPPEESPLERKRRRRRRRRVRMVVVGSTGLVLGIVLFTGPFAAVAIAGGGVVAARVLSKRAERKKDQRVAILSPAVVN